MSIAKQWSQEKSAWHFAIVDWEDRLGLLGGWKPVVVELRSNGPRVRPLASTEQWVFTPIADVGNARRRLLDLLRTPDRLRYDLLVNNCEHAARFIAFGEFRSEQIRTALVLIGLGVAIVAALREAA